VLTACFGVGALLAGFWVASRGRLEGTTRLAVGIVVVQAVATAGFVATGWFPLGMLCAALIGGTASIHGISVQTLIQSATDPSLRGRMLSIWGLITRACPAIGALALGATGEAFGLRWPTMVAALLVLGVCAWGWARVRRMEAELEGGPAIGKS
jgi:predicted MFS family arabinose efflux permease